MTKPKIERRKYPRVDAVVPLTLSGQKFDIATETKNISPSGAYCRVNKFIPVMSKLKVMLLVPLFDKDRKRTRKIECTGVAVRREPVEATDEKHIFNLAVFFEDISHDDRNVLIQYVNQHLPNFKSVTGTVL